jgi:predicted N-acetyltransferase YhbS
MVTKHGMLPGMPSITIRPATPADAPTAGQICFEAFYAINTAHNFPPDIPSAEMAKAFMHLLFGHPRFHCVIAEDGGHIVGSNCLDLRNPIAGIGPITVDPAAQNRGTGRALMQAVIEHARAHKAPGIRLVQAAFHSRSLSLYTDMGFDVREPLAAIRGTATVRHIEGCTVRRATIEDLPACDALCAAVHGHDRSGELADAIAQGSARVVERRGRITGYASSLGFFGHAVGEENVDLMALIAAAGELAHPGILLPTRNSELFRWCLAQGLRVSQPMTLMSLGLYNEPKGAFLPSVTY